MRGKLFLWARYIGLLSLLLPLLVWAKSHLDARLIGGEGAETFRRLQPVAQAPQKTQCYIWYMTGCGPCVREFPLVARLDSIGKATGKFSVTMIGLGTDSALALDKHWNAIRCHKVACESYGQAAYFASPSYHTLGKLAPPQVYPAYLLLQEGRMVRYRYGAAETLEELLP